MTLFDKVKAALKRGLPANQIAPVFGVSVASVEKLRALMIERGEITAPDSNKSNK